jgi:Prenyltransferase and squalene oxidase repeat
VKVRVRTQTLHFEQVAESLTPLPISSAIACLKHARNFREGWGVLRGVPTELYTSAVAVEALMHTGDEEATILAEDVTSYFRRKIAPDFEQLDADDLASLLVILHSEQGAVDEYTRLISQRLSTALHDLLQARAPVRITRVCWILRALFLYGVVREDGRDTLRSWLIARQVDDGGWPSLRGEKSSMVTTAAALRTLAAGDDEEAREACARGSRYLRQAVSDRGWAGLSPGGDIYTVAVVLNALGGDPGCAYSIIADGIDRLREAANPDGGWGSGPREPSNVEVTALAIDGLVAAGTTSFVPRRLAEAAIAELEAAVDAARAESEALGGNIQKAVDAQCGELLKERDALKSEVVELRSRAVRAGDLQRVLQRELYRTQIPALPDLAIRRLPFSLGFLSSTVAIGVVGASAAFLSYARVGSVAFYGAVGALLVSAGVLVSDFVRTRVSPRSRLLAYEELSHIDRSMMSLVRNRFLSFAERLPLSVREEVIYSLYDDFLDAPPDIAERIVQRLTLQLSLPPHEADDFREWATLVAQFTPRERRVLLESLRRTVLR